MNLKFVKDVITLGEKYNCRKTGATEGKHIKLHFDTPTGSRTMVVSRSASDHRAMLSIKTLFKQWSKPQ